MKALSVLTALATMATTMDADNLPRIKYRSVHTPKTALTKKQLKARAASKRARKARKLHR